VRGRALVIGGSVAGLFAAGLLRKAGWEPAVFERSHEDLAGRGAGIGTRPDLFAVMAKIGIAPDPSVGVSVTSRICLDRGGAVIAEHALPATNSAWDRIYRPLKDALPADCYRAGTRLAALEQDEDGVTAIFADGSRERGDVLIGADGFSSTVRQLVLPALEPSYAGYVAWRGVAEEADLPPEIRAQLLGHFTFCLPSRELIICLPMPGRDATTRAGERRFNWVWFRLVDFSRELPLLCTDEDGRCHGTTIPPPLLRRAVIAECKEHAAAVLAPQLARVVAETRQPFLQPIYDLAVPRLSFGRVTLVGDAAFVARPHVGTGVTKAAGDAQCLADALAASASVVAALAAYDRARTGFGQALVARGRALGAYLKDGAEAPDPDQVLHEYGAAGTLAEAVFRASMPPASAPPGA
jgi:2-polyprenyl-6-methoxyphenol hydroxylase-like FAD-dependent oxidoreductase